MFFSAHANSNFNHVLTLWARKSKCLKNNRDFDHCFLVRLILPLVKSNETDLSHYPHIGTRTLSVVTLSANFAVTLSGPILLHYRAILLLIS